MREIDRTANDLLRRKCYDQAKTKVTAYLRAKYPSTWRRILKETRAEFPDVGRSTYYSRAEQRLRKEFDKEARFWMNVEHMTLLDKVGYVPAPTGGHYTGRYAKPVGHPARVDFDAPVQQDDS